MNGFAVDMSSQGAFDNLEVDLDIDFGSSLSHEEGQLLR